MLAMQTKELATDDKPPISDEAAPVDTEPEPATEQLVALCVMTP